MTTEIINLYGTSTSATEIELVKIDSSRLVLSDDIVCYFELRALAIRTDSGSEAEQHIINGVAKRNTGAASVAMVATPRAETPFPEDPSWSMDARPDIVNGAVGFYFTGEAGKTISVRATLSVMILAKNETTPVPPSNTHSYQSYLDELASLIKDEVAKLSTTDLDYILAKSIADWGKDQPLRVRKQVTGTGTNKYVLNTILAGLWKYGYSRLFKIEFPQGNDPSSFLEDDSWDYYDDGSAQDGSNLQLYFIDDQPSTLDKFVIEFNIEPNLPKVGTQNFPDTNLNFSAITTLAASYACDRLATAYAQSTDGTITADVINYHDKSAKYTTLAKEYRKRYRILLFGSEDTKVDVKAAISQKELTPRTNTDNMSAMTGGVISSSYLFHRVRRGGRS